MVALTPAASPLLGNLTCLPPTLPLAVGGSSAAWATAANRTRNVARADRMTSPPSPSATAHGGRSRAVVILRRRARYGAAVLRALRADRERAGGHRHAVVHGVDDELADAPLFPAQCPQPDGERGGERLPELADQLVVRVGEG